MAKEEKKPLTDDERRYVEAMEFYLNEQEESTEEPKEIEGGEKKKLPPPDIKFLRGVTAAKITGLLGTSKKIEGKDAAKTSSELYKNLIKFSSDIIGHAESPYASVRGYVREDLENEVRSRYLNWMKNRTDLQFHTKDLFKTPEGRLYFRMCAFNHICDSEKLGLKPKDRLSETMDEKEFSEHIQKKLGRHAGIFEHICSSYDGGAVLKALNNAVDAVANSMPEETEEGFTERREQRAELLRQIAERIKGDLKGAFENDSKADEMTKFLGGGGDLALKYTALTMLFSNPLLAAGLWGARGITEALGYDFGQVLSKLIKLPLSLGELGVKKLFNSLSESWKEKLPQKIRGWIEKPMSSDFTRVSKASLPWGHRAKLFLRSLIPAPSILERLPYVKKLVAEKKEEPGKVAETQFSEAGKAIRSACKSALSPDILTQFKEAA